MAENLTKSQIAATTIPVGTIIVSAGAGTGKTTVLSHTVTQKMVAADHVKIDDLLVLTFTKKAAVEMAERIAERLKEMARKSDDREKKKRLLDAASGVPDAAIETLDAFAVKMLRDNPSETGLDPDFEVLSEERNLEIGHEAGRRLLEDWLANPPHELWPEVVKGIELENWPWIFHRLDQHLMTRRAMNLPALLMGREGGADVDLENLEKNYQQEIDNRRKDCIDEMQEDLKLLVGLLEDSIEIGKQKKNKTPEKAARVLEELPLLVKWLGAESFDWADPIIESAGNWPLFGSRSSDEAPKMATEKIKFIRSQVTSDSNKIDTNLSKATLLRSLDYEARTAKYRNPLARALMKFHDAALLARRNHNALSFADCEIEALNLLENFPAIRDKYNKKYRYVIVDEYQDINPLQQELIFKLARQSEDKTDLPSNLYVVGDERQSIYGFRDADFRLLRNLRLNMQDVRDENAGDRILHENFRSRPEILNFTNHLFRTIWGSRSDSNEIEHTDLKPSFEYYFRDGEQEKSRIELHIIKAGDSITGKRREAAVVAKRIYEIVVNNEVQVTEKTGSVRKIEWGDCAVLMSKRAGLSLMEHALSSLGVPFVTESGGGFWDTSEASDLISLLYCFSKSVDNLDWAVLLRSPIIGISDDGLMEISLASDRGNWRDVFKTVSLGDDSDRRKLATFIGWFESVEKSAGRIPVTELVDKAMQSSGYLEKAFAQDRGRVIRANIEKFISFLMAEPDLFDPGAAANYLTWLRDENVQAAQAGVAPTDTKGAVVLATVHASKGREWPLVVLADMNSGGRPNRPENLTWDENSGLGFKWLNPATGESESSSSHHAASEVAKERDNSESKRVMYVALTRAREYLILSGYLRRNKDKDEWVGYKSKDFEKRTNSSWLSAIDYVFTQTEESFVGKPDDDPSTELTLMVAEPQDPESDKGPMPVEKRIVELKIIRVIHDKTPDLKPAAEQKTELGDQYRAKLKSITRLPEPVSNRYLITATEIANFEKCPRMYAYRSVWNVPQRKNDEWIPASDAGTSIYDPGDENFLTEEIEASENFELPSSEWGNLAHKLMEKVEFDATEDQIRTTVEGLVDENNRDRVDISRLTEMAVKTLKLPIFQSLKSFKKEYRLIGKIGDSKEAVLGTLDLLAEKDGKILVIDYKSGKIKDDETQQKARSYSAQLSVYAHLVSAYKNIPLDKIETWIIFLHLAKPEKVDLSEEDYERTLEVLKGLSDSSRKNVFKEDSRETTCGWCDYRDICGFAWPAS